MTYTLVPDAQGYLIIKDTYKPGDVLQLKGSFKAIAIYDLIGVADNPIKITNVPGETVTVGDANWSGGAWPHGIAIRNSKYLEVFGESKERFKITGSNSTAKDTNGYPVRGAYFNLIIGELSDNVKVHDIMITNGGTGVWAKTEVSKTNTKTWFPNTYLENFEFYNLEITGTLNEAMYIGHTATWWNINTNQPLYTTPPSGSESYIKQPVKLRNVKIHDNYIHDTSTDGIQTAAVDNLEVYNNRVENWAVNKDWNHNGGILIGGRVKDFEVRDNKVTNGWGEFMQIYAEAGKAIVKNNLFVKNSLSGIGLRGGKDLVVEFSNNTILQSGESAFRINGASGGTGKNILRKNIIAQPGTGKYYYLENGGVMSDEDNKTFTTLSAAQLTDKFLPLTGSITSGYGYNATTTEPPKPEPPVVEPAKPLKLTITIPALTLSNLTEGAHAVKLTLPDGKTADIKIVVASE